MSTYLKPQSPLYHKAEDAYFYPLTTADQVVLEDGSRLNTVIGDSALPSITAEDNGKFLKVVNGSPAWVTVSNAEEASF